MRGIGRNGDWQELTVQKRQTPGQPGFVVRERGVSSTLTLSGLDQLS